jgi:Ion transport protein
MSFIANGDIFRLWLVLRMHTRFFQRYDEDIEARKQSRKALSKDLLTRAFEVMDQNKTGRIGHESIMALFLILNDDYPEIRTLSEEETLIIFGFLDKDGTRTITYDEFLEFGNVLLLEFTKESDYATFVEVRFPRIYTTKWYQRLCSIIRSTAFEYATDFVLLLNAVTIAIQSYPQLSGQDVAMDPHYSDGYIDTVWELIETFFTGVYVVEASLKILVDGWKKYSESPRNVFDFTITVLAVLATLYVYCE